MNKKGFTFIELMAVVVILGILAMYVMPKIFGRVDEAKVTAAKIQIKSFEQALKLFYLDNSFYPSTEQGLEALVEKPTTGRIPEKWREGGYLEKNTVPVDPWGHPYVYLSPGTNGEDYEIISYGKDGQEGGTGYDADISSSEIDSASGNQTTQ
ncbi:MAG TPA: type II secretion system major pseudopilin GspG [bacterium]|nr:type II secretion system major pseudopilin GspG [bacterium]HOL35305.1 type II secretion system major pseudopilin GspG [bacterium]HPP08647.1 type II secretion system major pseudopilin GspG [bacterium]HXK45597.1 type II secretion system major pseudopilin GspG [bacterium]